MELLPPATLSEDNSQLTFPSIPRQKANDRNPNGKKTDKGNLLVRTPTSPSSDMIIYRAPASTQVPLKDVKMSHTWDEQTVRADFRTNNDFIAPGMSPSLSYLVLSSNLSFFLPILNTQSLLLLSATFQIIERALVLDKSRQLVSMVFLFRRTVCTASLNPSMLSTSQIKPNYDVWFTSW